MQAPVLKRTTPNQFIGLALALGLAASVALNAAMLIRSDDGAPSADSQTNVALLAKQQRFYDAKTARIEALDAAAGAAYTPAETSHPGQHFGLLEDGQPIVEPQTAAAAWGQFMGDRADQIEASRTEAERVTALAAWGRFIEERNAKNDAAAG